MASFTIKQGDTAPPLTATLKDENGDAEDLTGADVDFHMEPGPSPEIDASATITDATAGEVRYDWAAGDTAASGSHRCEFEVTFSDGTIKTFPNNGYFSVSIVEEVG